MLVVRYILQLKTPLMPKPPHQIRSLPQLCDLERFFYDQVRIPEQKVTPINMPFFNFVCYAIDMLSSYVKSGLEVSFNVFLIDEHVRKYMNPVELYRRFIGFVDSWKKYADTDEGKLLASFLQFRRNQKSSVKMFLRLRKILLKNINQKILQEINLTHQDAVTVIHTLNMLTPNQRKELTKRLNDHFIAKNVKFLNTVILNGAIFCQYLLSQLNDRHQQQQNYGSTLSNKITNLLKNQQLSYIEEYNEEQPQPVQAYHSNRNEDTYSFDEGSSRFQEQHITKEKQSHFLEEIDNSKKSLVDLTRCMKELHILKQKDMEIDNRFRKFNRSRADLE